MGAVAAPLNFGMGGLNASQPPPPDFEKIFFNCSHMLLCIGYFYKGGGGGGSPKIDLTIKYMYYHLHRKFKKWTFYNVKILKCESFLITL